MIFRVLGILLIALPYEISANPALLRTGGRALVEADALVGSKLVQQTSRRVAPRVPAHGAKLAESAATKTTTNTIGQATKATRVSEAMKVLSKSVTESNAAMKLIAKPNLSNSLQPGTTQVCPAPSVVIGFTIFL